MGGNTELFKIVAALRDSLFMRVDLAYILPMHAGAREQVVIDLEAKAPYDGKRVLGEKVVDGIHRACRGVLDRKHAKVAEAFAHRAEYAFKGAEERDAGHAEELARGDLAIGALDALACYARRGWEGLAHWLEACVRA